MTQSKTANTDVAAGYVTAMHRRSGSSIAKGTVKFPAEFFLPTEETVLGLDHSGDPTTGQEKTSWNHF